MKENSLGVLLQGRCDLCLRLLPVLRLSDLSKGFTNVVEVR